jgi:hypothetical protein
MEGGGIPRMHAGCNRPVKLSLVFGEKPRQSRILPLAAQSAFCDQNQAAAHAVVAREGGVFKSWNERVGILGIELGRKRREEAWFQVAGEPIALTAPRNSKLRFILRSALVGWREIAE